MSSVLESSPSASGERGAVLKWAPVLAGLLVMYVPTYMDLAHTFWQSEDNAHGPLILAVVLWLLWRRRDVLLEPPSNVKPVLGGVLFVLGLVLYVVGRSQQFFQPDAFSQIPVLLGCILALQGKNAFKALAFPVAFLIFSVPIPGSLLDVILLPLKQNVSAIVEHVMYWLGYPIARTGVILNIGPYQLLIADACSGLNSMVALSSVGLLFVYLTRNPSWIHNVLLILLILPIAFLANVLRVMTLVLVTFHFGDAAGHSFHDMAGYAEIAFAFGAFFVIDWLMTKVTPGTQRRLA